MYERGENLKNWTSSPPAPPLALPSNECVTQLPAAESLSIYTHTRACTHRRVNIILETLFSQRTTFNPSFLDEPFCVCCLSLVVCVWVDIAFLRNRIFLVVAAGSLTTSRTEKILGG